MTEEQIIYQILNIIKGAELSNDDRPSERFVRSIVQSHRAAMLYKFYIMVLTTPDEAYQLLRNIRFNRNDLGYFESTLPGIIRFSNNEGVTITKNGIIIPLLKDAEFQLSLNNIMSSITPKASLSGDLATVFIGNTSPVPSHCFSLTKNIDNNTCALSSILFKEFKDTLDCNGANGSYITLDVKAILTDPSDSPSYDWTKDVFPFPAHMIEDLVFRVLRKEFNLVLSTKPDETGNMRSDNVMYQNEFNVNK